LGCEVAAALGLRAWRPVVRWRVIQEMIAWADSQATVGRNTRERCLELQRAKLDP